MERVVIESSIWTYAFKGKYKIDGYIGKTNVKSKVFRSKLNTTSHPSTISPVTLSAIMRRISRSFWVIRSDQKMIVEMEGSEWRMILVWEKGSTTLKYVLMRSQEEEVEAPVHEIGNWIHPGLFLPHVIERERDEEFSQALGKILEVYERIGQVGEIPEVFVACDHLYYSREGYFINTLERITRSELLNEAHDLNGFTIEAYNLAKPDESFLSKILIEQIVEIISTEHSSSFPVRNILLYGEAGSGKSTGAQLIAQALGLPYRFVNLSLNAEESDLRGSFMPNEDGTFRFESTPFLDTMKRGGVVELMEINYAKPGVLGILNSVMDRTSAIIAGNGEVVRRHPMMIIVATTNVNYHGTLPMNQALRDRFDLMQEVKKLSPEQLARIVVRQTGFDDHELIMKLIDVVEKISIKLKNDEIDGVCSTRQLVNWARDIKYTKDPKESAWRTILPGISLEKEIQEEIFNTVLNPIF